MKRFAAPVLAAIAAFVLASVWRGYPWQLALLTALAIGAFTYAVQRTWVRMRDLHQEYRAEVPKPPRR